MYKLIVIVLIFILGLVFYSKYGENGVEGYDNIQGGKLKSRCPDILIQKGSSYYLYNSKLAKVPGVNPLEFFTVNQNSLSLTLDAYGAINNLRPAGSRVSIIAPNTNSKSRVAALIQP